MTPFEMEMLEILPGELQQLLADMFFANRCLHSSVLSPLQITRIDITDPLVSISIRDPRSTNTPMTQPSVDWIYAVAECMPQLQVLRLACASDLTVEDLESCLPRAWNSLVS